MKKQSVVVWLCVVGLSLVNVGLYAQVTTPPGTVPAAGAKEDDSSVYNYSDTEINIALTTLARRAGVSVIIGEGVIGKITVHLENVTPKDAMRLIAESKGFVFQEEKGIVKIRTTAAAENQPLEVRIYTLKYAKAEDLKKTLEDIKGPKGKIQVDARSNTMVISDTPTNLEKIMPVLESLDTQTTQVMIEGKFIETIKNPQKDLGINWGGTLLNHAISAGGPPSGGGSSSGGSGSAVTGPFALKSGNLFGSFWSATAVLDAGQASVALSFLNRDSDSELLANPRVVTTDNGKAKINITQQYPIPQFTFSETTASFQLSGFQYKDIGITLNVTPRINKDKYITLEVAPEVSSSTQSKSFKTSTLTEGVDIPIVETRQITTTVIIKSGNTLAMGGLIREDAVENYSKVPLMGDLPLFGPLFRSKSLSKIKRNLLVFLTPTVISPDAENATGFEKYSNGMPYEDAFTNDKWMPKDNAKPRDLTKEWKKTERPAPEPSTKKAPTQNFGSK